MIYLYNQLEMDIMKWFYETGNNVLSFIFNFITNFGGSIIMLAVLGIIYWCFDKEKGENIAYSILSSVCLNGLLKSLIKRTRPFKEKGYEYLRKNGEGDSATGSSFPSGHSQNSGSLYSSLIINYKNKWIITVCICLIILVPISRLYLGVHWPSDVIVGTLLGIGTTLLCNYLLTKFRKKKFLIYLITLAIFTPFMFMKNTEHDFARGYGLLAGFIGGIFVENKFIGFSNDVSIIKKLLRVLIGILTVGLLFIVIKQIPEKPTNHYLINNFITIMCYALISFITIGVVPLIFKNKFNENGV